MQSLPIAGTSVLSACQPNGDIFVAATGSDGIHQLTPAPFDQQARALASLNQFAEALTMASYLTDLQAKYKASQILTHHSIALACVHSGCIEVGIVMWWQMQRPWYSGRISMSFGLWFKQHITRAK